MNLRLEECGWSTHSQHAGEYNNDFRQVMEKNGAEIQAAMAVSKRLGVPIELLLRDLENPTALIAAMERARTGAPDPAAPSPTPARPDRHRRRQGRGMVTQNVDDLHERAGSTDVIHMHGELRKVRCSFCGYRTDWAGDLQTSTVCPGCGRSRVLRPDIVWFGEIPFQMERIHDAVAGAGRFVAIGTSGQVYPAAGLVHLARSVGAATLEINNAETTASACFERHLIGPATVAVPLWVDELLAE